MKKISLLLAIAALPLAASAQTVYINETFDTDTIGIAPTDSAQRRVSFVTVAAGVGAIGTDNALRFNDPNATDAYFIEYNAGGSALSGLYAQFDLINNIPNNIGSASHPLIFGIGAWSDSTSALLGANTNRAIAVEFYANGSGSTLRLRSGGTILGSNTTYDMSAQQTVKVWINDHGTNTINYTRPDNFNTATLNPNSVVVWVNDVLIGGGSASGFTLLSGFTTGSDASLGRIGFTSGSATILDFSVDNIYIASAAPIPEPSTYAAIAGFAALGLCVWQRRRQHQA